jgi:hypothetical protein
MAEKSFKKCAHPPCMCEAAQDSKYCGAFCEGQAETAAVLCECGHPDCEDRG